MLILTLVADGLVNALPSGFHTFKDGMQSAWVRRHEGTAKATDKSLFGTVNLILAVTAAAWAVAVVLYRPASAAIVALAGLLALAATPAMIAAARFETRKRPDS